VRSETQNRILSPDEESAGRKAARGEGAGGPVIRVQGLWRDYAMGGEWVHALQELDLTIEANEYVAIMGPSGSGKSTLLNILGCLDSPTRGSYWLQGKLVSGMSAAAGAAAGRGTGRRDRVLRW